MLRVKVVKTNVNAKLPTRGSEHAAGWDLHAAEAATIPARGRSLIQTGLSFEIPNEMYGRIAPRSGLALKFGIDVGAGVVDSDYRGSVGVILFNHDDAPFVVKEGDRIAQIIFTPCPSVVLDESADHSTTERGTEGFGSTGVTS